MFRRRLTRVLLVAVLFIAVGANRAAAQPVPSNTCDVAVRGHQTLQELLALVGRLKDATPLWSNYRPAIANYVFVIPAPDQQRCALVWRDGAEQPAFPLAAATRLDTPLYGFYRRDSPEGQQPQELRDQFDRAGLREAVIIPLDGDARLGLSMTSRSWFIDMAIHEAVHLMVQFPAWAGGDSGFRWPAWTAPQPDRLQLAERCYGSVNPKEQRLTAERTPLSAAAIAAMTGGPLESVCRDTRAFMAERRRRWSDLSGVAVGLEGGTSRSCPESEAIMELNEGVPAFVAWLTARQLGVVDDDRLRAQFNVLQRDVFYTTGMTQLTVLRRLMGDRFLETTDRLAASPSLSDGGIFSALESELSRQCR